MISGDAPFAGDPGTTPATLATTANEPGWLSRLPVIGAMIRQSGALAIVRESGGFGRWVPVIALGMIGAMAEAVALVAVVQLAAAVSAGNDLVSLRSGVMSGLPELTVSQLLALSLTIVAVRLVAQIAFAVRTARLGAETTTRMRRRAISAWLAADWPTQTSKRAGDISNLVLGLVHQAANAEIVLARAAISVCNLIALTVAAIIVSPTVALSTFAVLFALFIVLRPLAKSVRSVSEDLVDANRALSTDVLETATGLEEFRLFGVADRRREALVSEVDDIGELWRRSQVLHRVVQPLYQGIGLALVVAGLAGARSLEADELGSLGAVVILLVRALSYSGTLQSSYQAMQGVAPSVETVRDEVETFESAMVADAGGTFGTIGRIEFDHVFFRYPGDDSDLVLVDANFHVDPGEVVGLVGRSGAGKSTVVQLLLRLRTPTSGRVIVDGRDLATISPSAYQRKLAVVPQHPNLIRGTVRENVVFLRDGISDDDIVRATRLAGVHDELLALPNGYDSIVGEGAASLSGGQLQRLALARALVDRPSLLVLDEPTSALDPIAEAAVRAAIDSLRGSVTVVVIAHRSSTLTACDRLLRVADRSVTSHGSIAGLEQAVEDPLVALLGDLA